MTVGNASGPAGLAVNGRTNTVYVDNTADDTVSVINGATCNGKNTSGCDRTPAHVAVGRQYFGYVAVDPATDLVYVTDYFDDAVSIIDGASCNATHTAGCDQTPPTVPAGASPTGVAVDQQQPRRLRNRQRRRSRLVLPLPDARSPDPGHRKHP